MLRECPLCSAEITSKRKSMQISQRVEESVVTCKYGPQGGCGFIAKAADIFYACPYQFKEKYTQFRAIDKTQREVITQLRANSVLHKEKEDLAKELEKEKVFAQEKEGVMAKEIQQLKRAKRKVEKVVQTISRVIQNLGREWGDYEEDNEGEWEYEDEQEYEEEWGYEEEWVYEEEWEEDEGEIEEHNQKEYDEEEEEAEEEEEEGVELEGEKCRAFYCDERYWVGWN
eukprot:Phypoly_transcript_15551.p1 GENE.Phypoly_transcript_15551~~Phypoly_transcript_15551.p1  ORF type:complete len:228 (+),score=65.13 Phypoly_transcript_15551:221-904(+)